MRAGLVLLRDHTVSKQLLGECVRQPAASSDSAGHPNGTVLQVGVLRYQNKAASFDWLVCTDMRSPSSRWVGDGLGLHGPCKVAAGVRLTCL